MRAFKWLAWLGTRVEGFGGYWEEPVAVEVYAGFRALYIRHTAKPDTIHEAHLFVQKGSRSAGGEPVGNRVGL